MVPRAPLPLVPSLRFGRSGGRCRSRGQDQIFNLLLGRDLQRSLGQPPQVVLTLPLLEGLDGRLKMSKSFGNVIALDETPNEMFGKIMALGDTLLPKYIRLLDPRPLSEVQAALGRLKIPLTTR